MTTPTSTLLRQLFPSWEFFDEARLPPTLQLRLLPRGDAPAPWLRVVQPLPRRWWHVVFNPAGTRTLAAQTLVERWYTELIELGEDAPASIESLTLVTALAESAVPRSAAIGDWQLRLIVTDDDESHVDVVYESDRLALPSARRTS
ncbi:hypothetical protein [Gemmatimonas sp.]|uniref:hypothetical protein n=1 Tax=Gemmatimonas sp. TaxID=1962908 RepID=UPI0037C18184